MTDLQRGEWRSFDKAPTTYLLRRLDADEAREVSAEVFEPDLDAER